MGVGNPAFDQYQLSEEQQLLREAVRQLADDKIAPRAAEIDEHGEFPYDVLDELVRAGFHAVHIPEQYGGMGADAISACIVVEEVARACASSSLIPAVNKLGSQPIILSGSEELKQHVLPTIAAGEAMISYALSEREAGSDAASMRTRARARRRPLGAQRHQVLDHQRRRLDASTRSWRSPTPRRAPTASRRSWCTRTTRASRSAPRSASSASRAAPPARSTSRTARIPADRIIGEPGTGFKTALRTLDHTRLAIGAQALGIAQGALDAAVGYVKQRRQFGKRIADFQGIQFMLADMAMRIEAARQLVYAAAGRAERNEPDLTFTSVRGEGVRLGHRDVGDHRRGAAVRRLRLHRRTSRSSG